MNYEHARKAQQTKKQQLKEALHLGNQARVNELEAEMQRDREDYADRVAELESEGLSTSDAQGVAEAEGFCAH